MSTIQSPPLADQSSHPVGFNEQANYDPFFPSSPEAERLVPIQSNHTPSPYSYQSPSPPQEPLSQAGLVGNQSTASFVEDNTLHAPQAFPQHGQFSVNAPHADIDIDNTNASYDFLSPNAYLSDNGYNASSEHSATPDYNSGFYLEEDYGMLDQPSADPLYMNHPVPLEDNHFSNPSTTTTRTQRASIGTATLSSHLMSPVLTDTNGAGSRQGTVSPPMANAPPTTSGSNFVPPTLNVDAAYQANLNQVSNTMQHTPTTTDGSKGSSPSLLPTMPTIARAPSPVVRIENYSRGDSPARAVRGGFPARGKRSRAGSKTSHLAVEDGGSSDEGEADDPEISSANGFDASRSSRKGLDPESRFRVSDIDLPSLKEQEENKEIANRNADVEEWLSRSASNGEIAHDVPSTKPTLSKRQRARSVGAQTLSTANVRSLEYAPSDAHIPGPGVLIDEDSGDDDSDMDDDDDEVASIENSPPPTTAIGEVVNETPGEARPGVYNELPNQPEYYRAKLWQDSLYDSSDPGVKLQPATSNAAIARFQQRAKDIDQLSRVATWGTRRMSDSDLHSLFRQFSISENPQGLGKTVRERSGSFLQQAAAKLKSRRNGTVKSSMKRHESEGTKPSQPPMRPTNLEHSRNDSAGSGTTLGVPQAQTSGLKRMSSLSKRPKSPRLNTGSAVAAMTSQIAALGASGPVSATSSPTGPWTNTKNVIKRSRSRSELNGAQGPNGLGLHGPGSPPAIELGLADLWTKTGGPPMPALAAPKTEDPPTHPGDDEDDDEDDGGDDHGVKMDLSIRADPIVPTLDGFKANIRQLNPRLPAFMFDRIAQEQLRRYKKLLDFKLKHAQVLAAGKCLSGKHCTELGGEPTYLPSRSNGKDADVAHAGFSVAGMGQADDDANALADGVVTPAQFPPGVPMPPVKRLPAEFECSLCFKVKKFHKPSDWSKHVHEDVQPFTCTFATCAEPKSFKRKADWVRHENERHRQLEWWMCNMRDCSHKCYRKDNFVQHLVREHKLPEPKVKTLKAGKPAVRGPSSQKARQARISDDNGDESHEEVDQVWKLVEECRHETAKYPKDEACKFCGNVCNTWKKLTVHLAKHMEQISMPVLSIVKQKDVTPETIISPIEQRLASQQASLSPTIQSPFSQTSISSLAQPLMDHVPGGFAARHRAPPTSMSMAEPAAGPTGYFSNPAENGYMYQPAASQAMPAYQRDSPQSVPVYQRVSPNTYPPPNPAQFVATSHSTSRQGSPYPAPGYAQPSMANAPTPSFAANNLHNGFASHPPRASPDTMYANGQFQGPTSQPRPSPFGDGSGYQYVNGTSSQPQQQHFVSSPIEGPVYRFPTAASNNTQSGYPQQQQQHQTQAQIAYQQGGTGVEVQSSGLNTNVGNSMAYGQMNPQQHQQLHQHRQQGAVNGASTATGVAYETYMTGQNSGQDAFIGGAY